MTCARASISDLRTPIIVQPSRDAREKTRSHYVTERAFLLDSLDLINTDEIVKISSSLIYWNINKKISILIMGAVLKNYRTYPRATLGARHSPRNRQQLNDCQSVISIPIVIMIF